MPSFDASSIIHAWDNYPIEQFPPMWDWLAAQIGLSEIVMSTIAFEEVHHIAPECAKWLKETGLKILPADNRVLQEALRIKTLLRINNDRYGAGVGENDIMIIATARIHNLTLITDEARQPAPPKLSANYKMPAVCELSGVAVRCMSLIEYIKGSGAIFR